jgi:hypothetical protein
MASRSPSWSNKTALGDTEKVYVAIAYNCGHADPRSKRGEPPILVV